jgi:hypothetical protein
MLFYESFSGKRAVFTTSKSIEEVNKAVHATLAPSPGHTKDQLERMESKEVFQSDIQKAVKNTDRPSGFLLYREMPHYIW